MASNANSCEKCRADVNINDLIHLTSSDFQPHATDFMRGFTWDKHKEMIKKYDELCIMCYLAEISKKE